MPKEKKKKEEEELVGSEENEEIQSKFKVDGIYCDAKVIRIEPDKERCIIFVVAQRDKDGVVIKKPITDSKGNVKEYVPEWEEKEDSMTESDFEEFIKLRQKCFTL